ncbi:hypothetical protein ABPG75_008088 [Micractinium tetrahymenae]
MGRRRGGGRGGGGGGGGYGEEGGSGRYEDQYGESMVGQERNGDRKEHYGFSSGRGGGGSKGGDAGSRTKPGNDVSFVRHVPKFLQAHAHMLGQAIEDEPEAAALAAKWDDGRDEGGAADDDDDEQEALRRAIEQDPSLLQQHPELQSVADKAEAEALKAKGNAAFSAGKLHEAVELFSRCIELDGGNHIYWSNRAAARTGLKEYQGAAKDAARCTELAPRWAKGWSRLGAAFYGLEDYAQAREAYERAAKLEPNDAQLQVALQKAAAKESKQISEGKHVFKRRLEDSKEDDGGGKRQQTVPAAAKKKEKKLLSFGDDEEEGQG